MRSRPPARLAATATMTMDGGSRRDIGPIIPHAGANCTTREPDGWRRNHSRSDFDSRFTVSAAWAPPWWPATRPTCQLPSRRTNTPELRNEVSGWPGRVLHEPEVEHDGVAELTDDDVLRRVPAGGRSGRRRTRPRRRCRLLGLHALQDVRLRPDDAGVADVDDVVGPEALVHRGRGDLAQELVQEGGDLCLRVARRARRQAELSCATAGPTASRDTRMTAPAVRRLRRVSSVLM